MESIVMKDFAQENLGIKDVGDGCCCSQKCKYWCGFLNKLMVVLNILFACAFLGAAAYNLPKKVQPDQWTSFDNFENIATGSLCIIMLFVFLFIAFFGGMMVSCRTACLCNICLGLWTLTFGIVLFAGSAILYNWSEDLKDYAC